MLVRTERFLRREHSKYKGPGMGIKPGELGGHTVPGLKSSYQGEPVDGEVRKAGKARLLSSLQDEDRSLDFILIIWETTNGFYR